MMEYEINSGVSNQKLSVKLSGVTQFDEFRYRMIRENTIIGIVPPVRSQENDLTVYTYDITGMQPVANRFQGRKLTLQDIKKIYTDIISTLEKSEEYFLDKNCFLLSEELILYEEGSKSYSLLYCPEARLEMRSQFTDFTEYVVNHTEYSDKAAVALIYEIFRMMRDEHTIIHEVLTYITEGRKRGNIKAMEPSNVVPVGNMSAQEAFTPKVTPPQPPEGSVQNPSLAKNPFAKEKTYEKRGNGFSTKKLFICTAAVLMGIGSFLALYLSGSLFMIHTKRLNMSKFAGSALIIGAVVFYICYKVFEMKDEAKEKKPKKEKIKKQKSQKGKSQKEESGVTITPVLSVGSERPVPQMIQPPEEIEGRRSAVLMRQVAPMQQEKKQCTFYRLVASHETNAEQLVLNKYPYVVGKSYEQVDGVIYSDAVSKVHAEFVEEWGTLYIIDMSSTNGTYVNKRKIASNEKVPIVNGDHIQIADKEYLLCS